MSNPTSYTDGTILADSFIATINSLEYVVNNLTMTTPSVATERNDQLGKLAAKKIEKDLGRMAGSCELQIDASARNVPLWGRTFTVPATANSEGEDFDVVIEEETANVVVNESRTRSVNIRRLIVQPS